MANTDSGEDISDINIVPLVDIILVVLIIFMVTAPALVKPSVKLDLPESASGDATEPSLFQVAITADGRVLVNNEDVDENLARSRAESEAKINPDVHAIIAADRDTPHGIVVEVMDWLKSSGIKNFAVTTDQPAGR